MDRRPYRTLAGFTLVELIVVVGIFTIISTIVLANHSRFNSSILLSSLAYDIGLSVRQAQVYGLSVRGTSSAAGFKVGYGIHVTSGNQYVFFADTTGAGGLPDRQYTVGDQIIESFTVGQGHQIVRFCGVLTSGSTQCSDSASPLTYLDIVFYRPEPDALMSSNRSTSYSQATITVSAGGSETRTVVVASTGQISIQNP